MSVIVVTVRPGRDGKLYQTPWLRAVPAELNRVRWLTHRLHCQQGLSHRAVQRTLLDQHGIRRSTGVIARDLALFECPSCAPQPPAPPDPARKARAYAWR